MRRMIFAAAVAAAAACGGKPNATKTPQDHAASTGTQPPPAGTGSAATAPPAPAFDPNEQLGLDPAVRHGVLPNGLTYYIKHNAKPEKRAQLWLAVNSGSVLETDDERGYSHLIEHIAFQGTKRFPKHDIADFIEKAGMKFGADLNAGTGYDETIYELMVPTEDPKIVDKGIDVLRDWTHDITFDNTAVLAERKIIEEERRTRNDSGYRTSLLLDPVRLKGSKYAERSPIGTVEVIAAANSDRLKKLYGAWYRPENMAVMIVGDIDAAGMEAEVKAKFSDVPKSPAGAPARPTFPVDVANLPPRYVVARDKEEAVVSVQLEYQVPHRPLSSAGDVRRFLVEQMFLHLVNSRLQIIAKRASSAWTAARVEIGPDQRPIDELQLEASAKAGKALDAVGDLTTEMARIRQHGFAADEIEQARADLLQAADESAKEVDTHDSRAVVEEMVNHFLAHVAMAGPIKELALATAILPTVTNEQLVAIAKSLGDKGRVAVFRGPAKATPNDIPSEADTNKRIAEAQDKPVDEWKAVDLSAPLIAADPAPGKVVGEKQLTNGVAVWTLSNGATVYLKPTDFKRDEITVEAISAGGGSQVGDKDYLQLKFASQIANASGYGNYGVDELEKKLAGKKVSIQTDIDDAQETATAVAAPADLEPALQLLYAAFTAPRTDQAAFDAWRTQQQQAAEVVEANSQAKFIIGALDFVFQGSPRAPIPFPTTKQIAAIKLDQAMAQFKKRFANAADFSFVVVGAFEPAQVKPLVEKYLASLPATKQKKEVVTDTHLRPRPGVATKLIKAGTEQKSMSILVAAQSIPWTPQVDLDARMLANVMELEMLDLLREKLGGTYSPNAQAQASREAPAFTLTLVLFESDPARSKEMQTEAWKALDALSTTAVKDDTIAKAKEQLQKSHDGNLTKNEFWVQALSKVARYGDDLDKLVKIDLSTVTADHVKQVAAKLIGKKNRMTITLMPEDAAPAAPAKK